jgi:hypothetical protein
MPAPEQFLFCKEFCIKKVFGFGLVLAALFVPAACAASGSGGYSASCSAGGVYVEGGTFTKQSGGVIYGSDASDTLKNTAHTVYMSSSKKRNTTAREGVTLDSTKDGAAGGGE